MEYDVAWRFPELAQLRRIARAEAYQMREDLQARRARSAVERARRLNRLADQMRDGGVLIHYLAGMSINAIALRPLREALPRIQDRAALESIVALAREYEQRRIPLWQCMQYEYYFNQSLYRDLATGRANYQQLIASEQTASAPRRGSPLVGRLIVNTALPEYKRIMRRTIEELKLPFAERPRRTAESIERELRHPLNQLLVPVFSQASEKELEEVALIRLLGVAAAVRAYKLRTGNYPPSLKELRLGEMVIDPFSGKPFLYRTDPRYGFLLYSVSRNRVDDGGAATYQGIPGDRGDLSPIVLPPPPQIGALRPDDRPLTAPLWMR